MALVRRLVQAGQQLPITDRRGKRYANLRVSMNISPVGNRKELRFKYMHMTGTLLLKRLNRRLTTLLYLFRNAVPKVCTSQQVARSELLEVG